MKSAPGYEIGLYFLGLVLMDMSILIEVFFNFSKYKNMNCDEELEIGVICFKRIKGGRSL